MKPYLLAGAVVAVLPLRLALAADSPSATDKTFVQQAAAGGMAEVQEGQLAGSKAKADKVKQFGQMMVSDHTPNNQELMTLAQKKGIAPPASLDGQHAQELAMLQKQTDTGFDSAYITGQISGHQAMASLMQAEIRDGTDPDLKAFAQKTLPVVQQHLQIAQQLQGVSKGAGTVAAAGAAATGLAGADNNKAPNGRLEKYHDLLRSSELSGANVYNDQGTAIGTIDDMLLGDDGKVQNVVVSVGGFLGLGTHYVAVPFSQLQVQLSRKPDTGMAATNGADATGATATGASRTGLAATGTTPGVTPATTTPAPAATAADSALQTQYYSLVLPGSTKDSLTKMPEFHYRS